MILQELYEYYDEIKDYLPDSKYEKIGIDYIIYINEDGSINDILPNKYKNEKGKEVNKQLLFPFIPTTTTIKGKEVEYRFEYVFGCKFNKEKKLDINSSKWEEFKNVNLQFIEDLNSPVINAFRNYINNNSPEMFSKSDKILALKKPGLKFAFGLINTNTLLNDDNLIKEKWNKLKNASKAKSKKSTSSLKQCVISGIKTEGVDIHNNLKGIKGANTSGANLVSFKENAFHSYGCKKGENSVVSQDAMFKYTTVFNYLTSKNIHKLNLNEQTLLFWSKKSSEDNLTENVFASLFSNVDISENQDDLSSIMKQIIQGIVPDIDAFKHKFNIICIKPNAARLCVLFHYKDSFDNLLENVIQHNKDFKLSKEDKPVSLYKLESSLTSPNSKVIDSTLTNRLLNSLIKGSLYPEKVLSNAVNSVKKYTDKKYNFHTEINIRTIKAYINRKYRKTNKEEPITMALDFNNKDIAYLCGRLFAVLENLQNRSSGGNLNKTIKDTYFSSACSTPATIFPNLIKLGQNHLSKVEKKNNIYYEKMLGDILDEIRQFPSSLMLEEQGKFILGYYQQRKYFFTKKEDRESIGE